MDKNIKVWNININNQTLYLNYSKEVLQKTRLVFKSAEKLLKYIQLNKSFDKENLIFLDSKNQNYKSYSTVLAQKDILKRVTVIKLKNKNLVIWKKENGVFNIKSIIE